MILDGGHRLRRRPRYFSGSFIFLLLVLSLFPSILFELSLYIGAPPQARVSASVSRLHSPSPSASAGLSRCSSFSPEATLSLRSGFVSSTLHLPIPRSLFSFPVVDLCKKHHLLSLTGAEINSLCTSIHERYNLHKHTVSNLTLKFTVDGCVLHGNNGDPEPVVVVSLSIDLRYQRLGMSSVKVRLRCFEHLCLGFVALTKHTELLSYGKILSTGNLAGLFAGKYTGVYMRGSSVKFPYYPYRLTAVISEWGETLISQLGLWAKQSNSIDPNCVGPLDPLYYERKIVCLGWTFCFISKSIKGLVLYGLSGLLLFLDLGSKILHVSSLWRKTNWVKSQSVRI